MIVVDRSALVAILRRELEADVFLRVLAGLDACQVSAVGLLETSIVLTGRHGDGGAWAELDALISEARTEVVPHDTALA